MFSFVRAAWVMVLLHGNRAVTKIAHQSSNYNHGLKCWEKAQMQHGVNNRKECQGGSNSNYGIYHGTPISGLPPNLSRHLWRRDSKGTNAVSHHMWLSCHLRMPDVLLKKSSWISVYIMRTKCKVRWGLPISRSMHLTTRDPNKH